VPLFGFLPAGHPFHRPVAAFRAALAARPECRALARGEFAGFGGRTAIHAEIKAVPAEGGGFRLDRFYWSGQRWRAGGGFAASTLAYDARDGRTAWQDFPRDSYLGDLAAHFAASETIAGCEVLRYVPLRRFTFRTPHPQAGVAIGKFKRPSRFRQAYALLERIDAALAHRDAGFAVARPLGLDAAHSLYFQEALPGADLSRQIDATNCETLLARVGELHARLHGVPMAGLDAWRPDAFRRALEQDLAWIGFVRPELADEMRRSGETLRARMPTLATDTFCHGDFACSQVLVDGDDWAITDFDQACLGDPCRDVAMSVAGLGYDLPWLERTLRRGAADAATQCDRAAAAYLGAYAAGRPAALRFAPDRLAWHRACAEIYYLALMFKKDRYSAPACAAGLARLRDALAELS
jgi:aminoglycoside phosphotransferase (APT) family kinase protein